MKKNKTSITPELVRDFKIGKNAHYHSLIRGKEIANKVVLYTKDNNDFYNYQTGKHEEKKCYVCNDVYGELYCFDQRDKEELLCCSEECYDVISLNKQLEKAEAVHRLEKMEKELDEYFDSLQVSETLKRKEKRDKEIEKRDKELIEFLGVFKRPGDQF